MAKAHLLQIIEFENLGMYQAAAAAERAGHQVVLSLVRGPRDAVREVQRVRPDLVGFSATTGLHRYWRTIAEAVRGATGLPIVIGGAHPTSWPQVSDEPWADFACVGEGDYALAELLTALDRRSGLDAVRGIYTKGNREDRPPLQPPVADLNTLPPPAKSLLYDNPRYTNPGRKQFSFGRGCPFSCTYCTNVHYRTLTGRPPLRMVSVERAIADLREVRDRWGLRAALFSDDLFGLVKDWTYEFLDRYEREVGAPFACHLMPGHIDARLTAALKRAGCHCASLGLETGSERVEREILGRTITREALLDNARTIKSAGIMLECTNIMATPSETFEEALSTIRFNRQAKPDFMSATLFQPFPGTELTRRALAAGWLPPDFVERIGSSLFERSPLHYPGIERIINLHGFFILLVRFPWLERFVLPLTKLPPNRLFHLVHFVTFSVRTQWLYRKPLRTWAREIGFWVRRLLDSRNWRKGAPQPADGAAAGPSGLASA
jgi:radical SAM superfamily enzyme YgiQ (UPF0313 family)